MDLIDKPFKELLGMHFNIPNYQRGYRWEKEHIEALLNDLQEFALKEGKEPDEFYCLQPVVVKKNIKLSSETGKTVYDLLDGQQRLTTLWLILNDQSFKLLWDTTDKSHQLLYDLQFESRDNLLNKVTDSSIDALDNIDLYYLRNAADVIEKWDGDKLEVISVLAPKTHINQGVKVIWYDLTDQVTSDEDETLQSSSINVFSRLNHGKISLTDTELIKALMLQSDIYPDANDTCGAQVMKERLFRISTEWDYMEKNLQDDNLWSMLVPNDYKPLSRMELLFNYVAKEIQKEKKYKIIDKQRETYFVIEQFLREPVSEDELLRLGYSQVNGNSIPDYIKHAIQVEKLWMSVRDAFNAIKNWHLNFELYHLLGLYSQLKTHKTNLLKNLNTILNKYQSLLKSKFKEWLEFEIGKEIRVDAGEDEKRSLSDIQYGEDDTSLRKILTAFNVYQHMKSSTKEPFDFYSFKKFNVTSLEHIHPQNLSFKEGQIKQEDIEKWIEDEQKRLKDSPLESAELILATLEKVFADGRDFNDKKLEIQRLVDEIDKEHDKEAGMTEGHMHTLYNMALVDKDTNAALGNNVIDRKRNILKDRESLGKTYVPLGTRYVFNKSLSPQVQGMKLWSEQDRKHYFDKIEEAYNYFLKETKNSNE